MDFRQNRMDEWEPGKTDGRDRHYVCIDNPRELERVTKDQHGQNSLIYYH